ncbi:hypothetical protein DFR29_11584 [Tahibacter aquaticus]|uniref:Uncharacterized protein n=1 Tax=Tahibacter aquaticus TaxID=520092 RepID=A0A4R6YPI5_9GAMM|nr:hypothetical protein DFR29_11584 [Tahibacter aquaticus]
MLECGAFRTRCHCNCGKLPGFLGRGHAVGEVLYGLDFDWKADCGKVRGCLNTRDS